MQAKQKHKLTKKEFDKLASEMRAIVEHKLKDHKDGDAEQLLIKA